MIDVTREFKLRAYGFSHATWSELVTTKAEVALEFEGKTQEEIEKELEQAMDGFNDAINHAYKENTSGYFQLGSTSVNILRFDAIRLVYVQDNEEYEFS